MQPTHINAYRAELADAELTLTQAKGKIAELKATIKDMESQDLDHALDGHAVEAPLEAPADQTPVSTEVTTQDKPTVEVSTPATFSARMAAARAKKKVETPHTDQSLKQG